MATRLIAECQDAEEQLAEVLDLAVLAFAKWAAVAWVSPVTKDEWERERSEPYPGRAQVEAGNAAIQSIVDAARAFIEDKNGL